MLRSDETQQVDRAGQCSPRGSWKTALLVSVLALTSPAWALDLVLLGTSDAVDIYSVTNGGWAAAGTFMSTGFAPYGPGTEVTNPRGVAVDPSTGHVYIGDRRTADDGFSTILEFDADGNFLAYAGEQSFGDYPGQVENMKIGPDGDLWFTVARTTDQDGVYKTDLPIVSFPTVTKVIDPNFTLADSSLGRMKEPVDLEFVGNTLFVTVRGDDVNDIQPGTFNDTIYRFDMTDSSGSVAGLDTATNAVKFWTGSNRPKGLAYDSANDRLLVVAHGPSDPTGGTAEVETSGVLAFSNPANVLPTVDPTDIYMISNAGEIKQFTGIANGASPIDGNTFASGGVTVATIAAYGSYQGFTMTPDGKVYGVNGSGGVDSWASVASWLAGDAATSESAAGTYGATGGQGSIHGCSYDGRTGGFYVTYEGDASIDGDIGEYATLADFINNTNAVVTVSVYGGNITNFYYPGEDAPEGAGPNPENSGANYIHITGGGQLEGWETLVGSVFGYVVPGQRTYQLPGFGNNVIGSFAVVTPNDLDNLPTVLASGADQSTPFGIAIFDGDIYVADEGLDEVLLIDDATQSVAISLPAANPTFMALQRTVSGSLWDGGATPSDSNWGTAANWTGDVLPDFPSEPVLIFGGTVGLTPNNETTGRTLSSVLFDSSAGAFDIGGQAFDLLGSISNNSSELQTISATVNSQGAIISATASSLTLGSLNATGSTATSLEPSGTASLENTERLVLTVESLTGSEDIDLIGTGLIDLTGNNSSFSGEIMTLSSDNPVAFRIHDSFGLGNTSGETTIGAGGNMRLEMDGGISVAENINLRGRYAEDDLASAIVSLSGDNSLTGQLSLIDGDYANRSGLNFRVEADTLTITQPFDLTLDGMAGGSELTINLAFRTRGAGRLIMNAAVSDDDDSSDLMDVYVGDESTLELNAATNPYSGITKIAEAGMLDLDGAIPNTSEIQLLSDMTVVDATDIGGLSLGAGQSLWGDGIVLGGVTAGSGSMIAPGQSAGVLSIDGDLTLQNGSELQLEVGEVSDLLDVTGALVGPGTNSGGITLTVGAAIPVYPGTNTTVIQASSISGLTAADFNVVVPTDLASLITSANVTVTATAVQLSFNVSDPTVSQVLALGSNGDGFETELWLVQGGFWTYAGDMVEGGGPRGIAQDPVTGDVFTGNLDVDGPITQYDKSFFPLEVIGNGGTNPSQRVEFLELDDQGNVYVSTPPLVAAADQQVFKYDIMTQTWSTIVPLTDGVNYTFGSNLRDMEIVGNRLFVADKNNARIVEFNTTTGAFVQVFDDTDLPQVSAITYDPNSDLLYVSCNIDNSSSRADDVKSYGGIAGNDGLAPTSEDIVFQTFGDTNEDRNIHGILVLDGDIYISSQGGAVTVDGIYRIVNPGASATTELVAAGDHIEVTVMIEADVTTAGRYDVDLDNDVDVDDMDTIYGCLNGPDVLTPPVGCSEIEFAKSDGDADGDVDILDLEIFLSSLGG